jgi:hypothetical protein
MSTIRKSPKSKRRKSTRKRTRVVLYPCSPMKKVSGLSIRVYFSNSGKFKNEYKYLYNVTDLKDRLAFLLSGPSKYLEQIDEELENYIYGFSNATELICFYLPYFEDHYRAAVIEAWSINTIAENSYELEDVLESELVDDSVLDYYDRLLLSLYLDGYTEAEIKRICSKYKHFYMHLPQILSKLRKAFQGSLKNPAR